MAKDKYTDQELNLLEKLKEDLILSLFDTKDKRYAIERSVKAAFDIGKNIGLSADVKTFTVKPCHNSKFKGIDCLESEDQYGFFNSEHDIRPGWCTWVNKKSVMKLYDIFTGVRD